MISIIDSVFTVVFYVMRWIKLDPTCDSDKPVGGPIFTAICMNKDRWWKTAEITMVGCDQATGREAPKSWRSRLDLWTIAEPQSRTNPHKRIKILEYELGVPEEPSRIPVKQSLTSLRRTRKKLGVSHSALFCNTIWWIS
jgi:hypothetical protein